MLLFRTERAELGDAVVDAMEAENAEPRHELMRTMELSARTDLALIRAHRRSGR